MKKVLIPLPSLDFDPSESGVPWKLLTERGVQVMFATPDAEMATADPRMVTGQGLGPWSHLLRADANGRRAHAAMIESEEFRKPLRWDEVHAENFDGLILPGGHAPGMKPFLESALLQKLTADFFTQSKTLGAICHGVVLAARSRAAGSSILSERTVTSLLRGQELAAWGLTCIWLGDYYRTYPETVQEEVTRNAGRFVTGPLALKRDTPQRPDLGFVAQDKNLITARWPGDVHRFSLAVFDHLNSR